MAHVCFYENQQLTIEGTLFAADIAEPMLVFSALPYFLAACVSHSEMGLRRQFPREAIQAETYPREAILAEAIVREFVPWGVFYYGV